MLRDLVRTGSLVLALLGGTALGAGNAVAQQQQPPAAEPQQQQQQEKAQQTPSGQMGKEEPSSHAPSAKPADNSVFVNGALAVPGAPENTDTVPAKFSEQNAADDKLSIAAYTFKLLTEEQRRAIYTALKGQPAGPAFNADIGAELPSSVELRPMPDDVVAPVGQDMRRAGAGRILITGSIAGFIPGTYQAVYNASKAFLDSFSFALRAELKDTGITVTCLMPGATETDFFERAGMLDTKVGQSKKDDPKDVAETGFKAMMRGDGDIVSGWQNKLQSAIANVTPASVLAEAHRRAAEPGKGAR